MNGLYAIKVDLKEFWNRVSNGSDKMKLLKEFSEKRYFFRKKSQRMLPENIRFRFTTLKRFKKYFKRPCFNCNSSPVIRHHIIALKNGGDNRKKNIIPLCDGCHNRVHPWLMIQKRNNQMDNEYNRVVGLSFLP